MADEESQTSQRSGLSGSLLERIRAQREREQAAVAPAPEAAATTAAMTTTTEAPVVPTYSPTPPSSSSSPAERNPSWSLNVSWPRMGGGNEDSTTALLTDDENDHGEEGYSMTRYFQTFMKDIYNGFRSLHPAIQVIAAVILLVIIIKLFGGM
mmetsp:Transcript_18639/g.43214  ORF Transcript_18639/g.43214 Transcript_18639/m.43214 type:complete len:153 (+) Transcript_18639:295-753(+)|eukprot:CAMPEP_0116835298 /NCGR_PEP_ID=MMETSP0418-20121206/7470_1 /TAXON_ID=1158023 /ORGANISM="Astrosyne radiata, Strain 13vi08-1A" /LENGTH=152 /DNA_ID=CAMNT_0004464955 /DNA_START=279 /DNA_END=737 /DNA_ORIENTATION=-